WLPPAVDVEVAPIAVVGMATRFGGVQSLDAFRRAVFAEAPPGETSLGLMDELDLPLDRFRVPPKELEEMLPQQLLMLQVADEALRDVRSEEAGIALRTGVIIALDLDWHTTNFHLRWAAGSADPPLTANRTMGALASVAASRVARMI